MTSKINIFHTLQHASDSEEDNDVQTKSKKNEKKEQRTRQDNTTKPHANRQVPPGGNPDRQVKEDHTRTKGTHQQKGVTNEPHPQDRHSGHGNQAFGAQPKKAGAGKGNWGNYKEDRKRNDEQVGEAGEEGTEQKPQEEEPVGITLAEYYSQTKQSQNEPQVNEAKAKITSEQLRKELGTATALKTRTQQQVDDRKVGKKKDRLDVDHHAGINSEHANLLNFRTGFIEKEYRKRGEDGEPRRFAPRTGGQRGERENAKEEETQPQPTTEGQTTEAQTAEGETQQAEGEVAEGQTSTQNDQGNQNRRRYDGQRGNRGGRGGRGGYRGDRQHGDRPQGDRPHGDRPHGDRPHGDRPHGDRPHGDRPRKPYGGKDQGKVNFEDESAFPKLG